MGISVNYVAITKKEFYQLLNKPDEIAEEILTAYESSFSLYKQWHVFQFILTDDASLSDEVVNNSPLMALIRGGNPTPYRSSFGVYRYFLPEQVNEIATALSETSIESLLPKFDADVFNDFEIYPIGRYGGWDEEEVDDEAEATQRKYPELVNFFVQASINGDVVITAMV
jgi:hypothetical protein